MVDDVPEESQVKKDLHFFESNFSGIMPLEVVVEFKTKKRRPVLDVNNLAKVEEFEMFLDSLPMVSKPVSILSFVKASKQAFYNNNPARYNLPSRSEGAFILRYMRGQSDNSGLFQSFVDTTFTRMRISSQIADIGSERMDSLVNNAIEPRMREIFTSTEKDSIESYVTGSTKIFIKGNNFLIDNLRESLLLAFLLITLSMAILFANVRMIAISLVPNLLALMITAGLMGFLDIPLKASTALIFSITFGISVDNSIRFLAKYRQEILSYNFFIPVAVSDSILVTGKSIIYTSIVLFAGFIIAYPGPWKVKLFYVPIGVFLIYLLNVLRIMALGLNSFHSRHTLEFNHKYTFAFVVYACIFGFWMLWIKRYAKPDPATIPA